MAFTKKCLIFVCLAAALFQASMANTYFVGGSAGWTIKGDRNEYTDWAANETFKVGDSFVFNYDPKYHNVMQVTHKAYGECDLSAPRDTYNTGNDTITIKKTGHYFFICGTPGHCQAGQKVNIRVVHAHHHHHLAPAPAPVPITAPSPTHTPANNNAASSTTSTVGGTILALLIGFFLFLGFTCQDLIY